MLCVGVHLHPATHPSPAVCRLVPKLWDGPGSVMAIVYVTIPSGQLITASITRMALRNCICLRVIRSRF